MRRDHGWSLVEVVVVVAIVALLGATIGPSLGRMKERSRLAVCALTLHDIHSALWGHAVTHQNRLPPFAFSDTGGDLALSGHWGGVSQPCDPAAFMRRGMQSVNLWALVDEGALPPGRLLCPSAGGELRDGTASLFPFTFRFSTYCLRFPTSEDLFIDAPNLARRGGPTVLSIYTQVAGGQKVRIGMYYQQAPVVRVDLAYRLTDGAACGDGVFDARTDAVLADLFWRRDWSADGTSSPGLQGYPVRWAWSHGSAFNAAFGDGAVRTVDDDGTVAANSVPPGASALPDDGAHFASYAERVWQFLDRAR
jgi:type II secretory pathway pseudopilin PulG